jgi:hypothetical protein
LSSSSATIRIEAMSGKSLSICPRSLDEAL